MAQGAGLSAVDTTKRARKSERRLDAVCVVLWRVEQRAVLLRVQLGYL